MSNAFRDFTVVRRRPRFIDLITPKRAGVKGYRFQASTNFSGTFTTIFTADIGSGYLDPAINTSMIHAINNIDHVRAIFDPQTFSASAPNLDDTNHIWLKYQPIDFAGAAGTAGNPVLILPDDEIKAAGRIILTGTAPNGASVAASLVLCFPFRMQDIHIRNNEASGGTILYVASAVGGAERQVAGQETATMYDGAQGCLLIRGGGATASVTIDFTHYLPL